MEMLDSAPRSGSVKIAGMRNLLVPALLTVAILCDASYACASDNMCPDYPQYRKILDQGEQTLKQYPGSFSEPIDLNSIRGIAIPVSSLKYQNQYKHEVEPEIIQRLDQLSKEPVKGIDPEFETLCFHAARCLFSNRQFTDAINFLEKMSKAVKPNTICFADTAETLADAHWMEVFGGDSEYSILVPAFDAFKKKATFTPSDDEHLKRAQENYSKAVEYLESNGRKIDKVRLYVYLSAIANHFNNESEAIRLKDKALSSFYNAKNLDEVLEGRNVHLHLRTYDYPCLFTENSKRVFSSPYVFIPYPMTYLHDVIACAKTFHDDKSIVKLSQYWLDNKHPMPLPADALPSIIEFLPKTAKSSFPEVELPNTSRYITSLSEVDLLDRNQYGAVYSAFVRKGWKENAEALKEKRLRSGKNEEFFEKGWGVVLAHLENKEEPLARKMLTRILIELRRSLFDSENAVKETQSRLKVMQQKISQLKGASLKDYEGQIAVLQVDTENRLQKLECLSLAKKLAETGWQLEKRGDPGAARKMYKSALEIKRKNLSPGDREIGLILCDMARLEANENNPKAAELLFLEALGIFRKKSLPHDLEYRAALENYAGFLKKNNRPNEAEKVYQEARTRT